MRKKLTGFTHYHVPLTPHGLHIGKVNWREPICNWGPINQL